MIRPPSLPWLPSKGKSAAHAPDLLSDVQRGGAAEQERARAYSSFLSDVVPLSCRSSLHVSASSR